MTFKVTALLFDDNQDVAKVVVDLDTKTYQWASGVLAADLALKQDPEETERPVRAHIPRTDALTLFTAAGTGADPQREVTQPVYESLLNVMVMLDDEW